jgi:hypothetical protein
MLPDTDLYRAAGASTIVAIIALVAAGVAFALFLGGAGAVWGPVNDLFVVVTAIAMIVPMLAVDRLAADQGIGWMRIVTIVAVLGALLIAVGQTLLVLGVISLGTSFVTGGVGFLPVAVWLVALVRVNNDLTGVRRPAPDTSPGRPASAAESGSCRGCDRAWRSAARRSP